MSDNHPISNFARNLVREVGEIIISNYSKRLVLSDTLEKGPLAQMDIDVHRAIEIKISKAYPEHFLISEEGSVDGDLKSDTWICDPICGTYNFIQGIPYFAIGLSYLKNGKIQIGIIYNPVTQELFFAEYGKGAYLNDKRIQVSSKEKLEGAVVNFNANFSSPKGCGEGKELFSSLCPPATARLRLTESANLDLAYVACGRYDAYIHPSDKVWDKTAGKIIVEEAGGQVLDFSRENKYSTFSKGVIATNGKLTEEIKLAISTMFVNE